VLEHPPAPPPLSCATGYNSGASILETGLQNMEHREAPIPMIPKCFFSACRVHLCPTLLNNAITAFLSTDIQNQGLCYQTGTASPWSLSITTFMFLGTPVPTPKLCHRSTLLITLRASCSAVYCNRSCLIVAGCVCGRVGLLPR